MCCEVSLEAKYLRQIREILDRELGDIPARAFIFGSRARSGERESSDIDLAGRHAERLVGKSPASASGLRNRAFPMKAISSICRRPAKGCGRISKGME